MITCILIYIGNFKTKYKVTMAIKLQALISRGNFFEASIGKQGQIVNK